MGKIKTFSSLLDKKYGKRGTKKREEFEKTATAFIVVELIK